MQALPKVHFADRKLGVLTEDPEGFSQSLATRLHKICLCKKNLASLRIMRVDLNHGAQGVSVDSARPNSASKVESSESRPLARGTAE